MKRSRKKIECTCDFCSIRFMKDLSEFNRNLQLNRRNFCSRTCTAKALQNFGDKRNTKPPPHGRLIDEYSKFRDHMRRIRNRYKNYDIDVKYLKEIWDKQDGICPYTGIKMILKGHSKKEMNPLYIASVDRIDSNLGYVVGNIQWVCAPINYMKSNLSNDQVLELCKIIQQHFNTFSNILVT